MHTKTEGLVWCLDAVADEEEGEGDVSLFRCTGEIFLLKCLYDTIDMNLAMSIRLVTLRYYSVVFLYGYDT